jgi:hypothetical protein
VNPDNKHTRHAAARLRRLPAHATSRFAGESLRPHHRLPRSRGGKRLAVATRGTDTEMNERTLPDELEPQEYMLLRDRCAICHWPAARPGRWMELHHIVGGAGRRNVAFNYLATCNRCHHAIHNRLPDYGEIPKGAVLTAKAEEDGRCDPERLAALTRRTALPYDREPIPPKFLEDRRQRGGAPWP